MKLKNGWRRWTTPTTIKRRQDRQLKSNPVQTNLAESPARDYEQPEIDWARHEEENKTRRHTIARKRKMGEAKEIVGKKEDKIVDLSKKRKDKNNMPEADDGSLIERLSFMIDDIDKAITVKQKDLANEGASMAPENHYKLGILRAVDSLVRRAQSLLEDYDERLVYEAPVSEADSTLGKIKNLLGLSKEEK